MSVCQFPLQARVAFKNDTKMRGFVYDWFDGDRDIPASKSLYAIQWTGISGYYWYYADDLVLEKDLPVSVVDVKPVIVEVMKPPATDIDVGRSVNYAGDIKFIYDPIWLNKGTIV